MKKLAVLTILFLSVPTLIVTADVGSKGLENFLLAKFAISQTTFLAQSSGKIFQQALPPGFEILARSALVLKIEPDGGRKVLFEQSSREKLAIASLTKLMTAVVSIENQSLSQEVEIGESAARQAGNNNVLKVGERLPVSELLKMTLIESSNAAAQALAENFGREKFVELMNLKAKELGLKSTRFSTPTGLESQDNFSTAGDLANLAAFILKNHPSLFEISSRPQTLILTGKGQIHHLAVSTNDLLGFFPDERGLKVVGGKTGFTPEAGGSVLLVLRDETGNDYINVILGAQDSQSRFTEMQKLIQFFN